MVVDRFDKTVPADRQTNRETDSQSVSQAETDETLAVTMIKVLNRRLCVKTRFNHRKTTWVLVTALSF